MTKLSLIKVGDDNTANAVVVDNIKKGENTISDLSSHQGEDMELSLIDDSGKVLQKTPISIPKADLRNKHFYSFKSLSKDGINPNSWEVSGEQSGDTLNFEVLPVIDGNDTYYIGDIGITKDILPIGSNIEFNQDNTDIFNASFKLSGISGTSLQPAFMRNQKNGSNVLTIIFTEKPTDDLKFKITNIKLLDGTELPDVNVIAKVSDGDPAKLTVAQLKTKLDNQNIEYKSTDKKADLIEKLSGGKDE